MAKNPIVGAIIMLLFVAGLVAFGCYEYADLKQFQQEGGTRTMNSMLVLVYNIGGPAGVLVFFLLAAAVCLGAAAKTIVKRSA